MSEKGIQFRKKRELGDILSDSFVFLKQEYKPLLSLILIYVMPFLILYGVAQVYFQTKMVNFDFTDPEKLSHNIGAFYSNVFFISLFGVFVQSLLVGTFYSFIEVYVKKGKGNFELAEIKPLLFSNSLLALAAGMVVYLLTIAGMILCFVPGIYFANTFSLTAIIIIFEKKGLGNALGRSRMLVHTQWWNTLLINIIGIIIIMTVSLILSIPTMISEFATTLTNTGNGTPTDFPVWIWIYNTFTTAVASLLWIIPFTFWAMQYFNLDERTRPEILNKPEEL